MTKRFTSVGVCASNHTLCVHIGYSKRLSESKVSRYILSFEITHGLRGIRQSPHVVISIIQGSMVSSPALEKRGEISYVLLVREFRRLTV